jgi:hypothetical protein
MELTLLVIAIVVLLNAVASVVVLRVPVLSSSQRSLQLAFIWLVPIIGAVVCTAFAHSQSLGATSPSTLDPLYTPSDGGAPDGPALGICGCSASNTGGGGAGDGD